MFPYVFISLTFTYRVMSHSSKDMEHRVRLVFLFNGIFAYQCKQFDNLNISSFRTDTA